jgi:hypothetical protein
VAVDLSAAAFAKPAWLKGAEVRITAQRGDTPAVSAAGAIAPGDRSVGLLVPVDGSTTGPWLVTAQVLGPDGTVEARTEIPAAPSTLIGEPLVFRGAQSLRVPFKPLADLRLLRTERLRVEWPELQVADTRTARLLDRKGAALGAQLPLGTPPADRKVVIVDLPMSALPEGEFVVELAATKGDTTERRFVAFRVIR